MSVSSVSLNGSVNNVIYPLIDLSNSEQNNYPTIVLKTPDQSNPNPLKTRVKTYNDIITRIRKNENGIKFYKSMDKQQLKANLALFSLMALIATALLAFALFGCVVGASTLHVNPAAGTIFTTGIITASFAAPLALALFTAVFSTAYLLYKDNLQNEIKHDINENKTLHQELGNFIKSPEGKLLLQDLETYSTEQTAQLQNEVDALKQLGSE